MIVCQGCDAYCHLECVGLTPKTRPRGEFNCQECLEEMENTDSTSVASQRIPEPNKQQPLTSKKRSNEEQSRALKTSTQNRSKNRSKKSNQPASSSKQISSKGNTSSTSKDQETDPIPSTSRETRTQAKSRHDNAESARESEFEAHPSRPTSNADNANQINEPAEDDNEYYVEDIVGHGYAEDGTLLYETKWVNYPSEENTWEPESVFAKIYPILKRYKDKHNLGPPTIMRVWGSSNTRNANPSIWNSPETIVHAVKSNLTREHRDLLEIKVFEQGQQLDDHDCIYLIDHGSHVLVGLYRADSNSMTLADGGNGYLEDPEIQEWLGGWLKIRIRAVQFPNQIGIDHCSSSAAAIAIKFIQSYAAGIEIRSPMVVPKTLHETLVRAMHKGPSASINSWRPAQETVMKFRCPYSGCNYYTRRRNQRQMGAHIMNHKLNNL